MSRLRIHFFRLGFLVFPIGMAHAVTIDAIYFGQTHVMKADQPYFTLVGNRDTLIKVHVTDPLAPLSPATSATLTLNSQNLVLPLTGPANLPMSIPDGPGVVQHTYSNSFTATIPAAWVKKGLQVTVNAGEISTSITNLSVGAPSKLIMNMTDVHYFAASNSNYPAGTLEELEAKWPVSDLEVRRFSRVIFPELVIPPRGTFRAARIKSPADYLAQTGSAFDGEQAAALAWNGAIRRAAGRSGAHSLYYLNIYNANAGGQAGGFAGVGNGSSNGILIHELGHALSLPHWGDSSAYPYKGAMHGIAAPPIYNATHSGPTWAFDIRNGSFISPSKLINNVQTYKVDPMQGGGTGYQESPFLMNHFSDYSANQMRSYLQNTYVIWNPALGASGNYAKWNQTAGDYTTTVTNNGVQFPQVRDTQVITIMASLSGANPGINMVYPPIGPYTGGLIKLFDPTVAAERSSANSIFSPSTGSDFCVRVVQGGVQKTYILAASSVTTADPFNGNSLITEAINLPSSAGVITKIELLATPDVEDNGLPVNPQILHTWSPLTPDPASFASLPSSNNTSSVSMRATAGKPDPNLTGTVEYQFTETSGNPGATTSAWQTSVDYTDTGLQASTTYTYAVAMRIGSATTATSAPASATTATPDLTPPTLLTVSPLDNSTNVSLYNLTATFSEPIVRVTGNLTIKNLTDSTQILIPVGNSQVILSGSTLSIYPVTNLLAGKNYAVRLDSTAITDLEGNPFPGIMDDTTWNFSTAASTSGAMVISASKINGVPTFPILGAMVVVDVPYFSTVGTTGPSLAGPLGPGWANPFDAGWKMASGSSFEADHGQSPWEPDGTLISHARTHRLNSAPGSSYTFNLPDGAIINAIYATWLTRGTSGVDWRYIEGGPQVASSVSMVSAPSAHLKLNWTDAVGVVRTGDFQRLFASPITVVGANGFTLNAIRTGNTHQADAVVLDVTLGSPEIALEQPANTDIPSNGSRAFGNVILGMPANLPFIIRNTGNGVLNLTGAPLIQFSGTHAQDFTLEIPPANNVAAGGSTTPFTVRFAPGGVGLRSAALSIANNDSNETPFTLNLSGIGQTAYQSWSGGLAFDADANSDGIANGLAWILGAPHPQTNAAELLPTIDRATDPDGKLLFIFRRVTPAAGDPNTVIGVEYGSTIHTWNTAVHQGNAADQITIIEQTNGFGLGIDKVTVALPPTLPSNGRFFVRLKASSL